MDVGTNQAKSILERILSSYGVSTRQQYSEIVGVPLGTIANWVSRDSLPGDYVIQCALDTDADLRWLTTGELKNVSSHSAPTAGEKGKKLHERMLANGGKKVLQRILHAYGFTMQKELGDLLGIPSGTMSAWVRRDYFPGDIVITCALDTGAPLRWLATGIGETYGLQNTAASTTERHFSIEKYSLHNGKLENTGEWICDKLLIDPAIKNPAFIEKGEVRLIVDFDVNLIGNGMWLIDIDGVIDVYNVSRLPGGKLNIKSGASSFECLINDIRCVGMVCFTISKVM
ncbi:phage repressor protein CI [Nissabacter sp. SGAir0207]|uniref:phage repressor protein CI n=1 Tax=Nissabacter sp. SGAir0207 TaxID=2126321 RepID=UPI0010CD0DA0|nr:phage repressor protein CI [Nissabacter sp. SGAir0207]QCR37026.1 phage repressor protein CI [Nissabacter sp. SGAir0207]